MLGRARRLPRPWWVLDRQRDQRRTHRRHRRWGRRASVRQGTRPGCGYGVGALIGASIGHQIAVQHTPPVRERIGYERRCSTAYETRYEERIEGYDVTYRYNGRLYHTRMPYDPGDRIAIRVDVRPVGYARY